MKVGDRVRFARLSEYEHTSVGSRYDKRLGMKGVVDIIDHVNKGWIRVVMDEIVPGFTHGDGSAKEIYRIFHESELDLDYEYNVIKLLNKIDGTHNRE